MPFCAERMITGSASRKAASAFPRSPAAMASSTLRTQLRIFERRALLIAVRRAILRAALRAETVLAMLYYLGSCDLKHCSRDRSMLQWRALIVGEQQERQRSPGHGRRAGAERPQAIMPDCDLRLLGSGIGKQRWLHARPLRVLVNVCDECLYSRHELLSVEQLANSHGLIEGARIARSPCLGAEIGIKIGGCG